MEETQMAVAIRPIFVLFSCCGYHLNEHQSFQTIQRIHSTICFGLYTAAVFHLTYSSMENFVGLEWNLEIINQLFVTLTHAVVSSFVTNTVMFILSCNGMGDFWKAVRDFEKLCDFDYPFYRTIRRQSWVAVIFILVDVGAIIIHIKKKLNSYNTVT